MKLVTVQVKKGTIEKFLYLADFLPVPTMPIGHPYAKFQVNPKTVRFTSSFQTLRNKQILVGASKSNIFLIDLKFCVWMTNGHS